MRPKIEKLMTYHFQKLYRYTVNVVQDFRSILGRIFGQAAKSAQFDAGRGPSPPPCASSTDRAIGQHPTGARKPLAHYGFVISTADSQGGMVDIHERRPVALGAELAREWIAPHTQSAPNKLFCCRANLARPLSGSGLIRPSELYAIRVQP
jgi:hypothetical protein